MTGAELPIATLLFVASTVVGLGEDRDCTIPIKVPITIRRAFKAFSFSLLIIGSSIALGDT